MIIQHLAAFFVNRDSECVHNAAKALDWITAIALLIIGILAACNVIALSAAIAYSFLGAGIVYTLVMIMNQSLDCYMNCSGGAGGSVGRGNWFLGWRN
jgi:hypothetical protein